MDNEITHLSEEQLVLHYYGDSENGGGVEAHLASCLSCREDYTALQRLLNSVDSVPVPERGPEYGERVWGRVSGELGLRSTRPWWKRIWSVAPPRWAMAGTVTLLIALAFLAGRWTVRPSGTDNQVVSSGSERVLLSALGEHLDRSQMTLVSLANSVEGETPLERDQAEDLLRENRLYRQAALRSGDGSAAAVLDELERVLTEVANAPGGELGAVRQRVVQQDLLFKIRVLRSQLSQKEKAVRPMQMLRN